VRLTFHFQDEAEHEPVPGGVSFETPPRGYGKPQGVLAIDGVPYHSLDSSDVPAAHSEVPVELNDNGEIFDTAMLAGLVGMTAGDSGVNGGKSDELSPVVGWWMFTVKKGRTGDDEDREEMEAMMARFRSNTGY
jgi:hypothetical protein